MNKQEYIKSIIETGIANGITVEQMMANPKKAMQAHLKARLKMLDEMPEKVRAAVL